MRVNEERKLLFAYGVLGAFIYTVALKYFVNDFIF
jgi:hypothetical protein